MKILCLGSLNIDRVYGVDAFVNEGETISALSYNEFPGGKGLNQTIALARAGAQVYHAGKIGPDGIWLKDLLESEHVDVSNVIQGNRNTGHAVIQVNSLGKNCIIVTPGANGSLTQADVDAALDVLSPGDLMLVQNETSCVSYAIQKASKLRIKVVLNPSPITPKLLEYPLELVDYLILNETEALMLTAGKSEKADGEELLKLVSARYPKAAIILTLGEKGSLAWCDGTVYRQQGYHVTAVDTTAAGDTYCGFLLADLMAGKSMPEAMDFASRAAALAVTRHGAVPSIPLREEVLRFTAGTP